MNFLKKAWAFLNGHKTWIGTGLLVAAGIASGHMPPVPYLGTIGPVPVLLPLVGPAMATRVLLGGVGGLHKVYKLFAKVFGWPALDGSSAS